MISFFYLIGQSDVTNLGTRSLIFSEGSQNGEQKCVNITSFTDNMVEGLESFQIFLSIATASSLSTRAIGNTTATFNIRDEDGMCVIVFKVAVLFLFCFLSWVYCC